MHHTQFTEAINPYNPNAQAYYETMAQLGLSDTQTLMSLARSITAQGFIIGANEIFWLSGVMFMLLFVVVWFAKPPFGNSHQ